MDDIEDLKRNLHHNESYSYELLTIKNANLAKFRVDSIEILKVDVFGSLLVSAIKLGGNKFIATAYDMEKCEYVYQLELTNDRDSPTTNCNHEYIFFLKNGLQVVFVKTSRQVSVYTFTDKSFAKSPVLIQLPDVHVDYIPKTHALLLKPSQCPPVIGTYKTEDGTSVDYLIVSNLDNFIYAVVINVGGKALEADEIVVIEMFKEHFYLKRHINTIACFEELVCVVFDDKHFHMYNLDS
jgi:hypothetical protein